MTILKLKYIIYGPQNVQTILLTNFGPFKEVILRYEEVANFKTRNKPNVLAMLTAMDFAIERLINYLKKANLYHNTVIIFTSDVR